MPARQPSIAVKESVTALQAVTPFAGVSDYKSIYVIGEGFYVWREGDQSPNLPDATNEWVAPETDTSGASGAWQRDIASGGGGGGTTEDARQAPSIATASLNTTHTGVLSQTIFFDFEKRIRFNNDGTVFDTTMHRTSPTIVSRYNLSTAWDLTTATFDTDTTFAQTWSNWNWSPLGDWVVAHLHDDFGGNYNIASGAFSPAFDFTDFNLDFGNNISTRPTPTIHEGMDVSPFGDFVYFVSEDSSGNLGLVRSKITEFFKTSVGIDLADWFLPLSKIGTTIEAAGTLNGFRFSPLDGRRMVFCDFTNNELIQVDLGVPYRPESYVRNSEVTLALPAPTDGSYYDFTFKPDGTKLYVMESGNRNTLTQGVILEYDLTPP